MKHLLLLLYFCCLALSAHSGSRLASFCPFPKAGDSYWQETVPAEMRADYIALGEQYHARPWLTIPQETFAEFRTNGNRTHYEAASFGIRTQFAALVMAEIMEQQGRFLPDICQGLHYFIDQEVWWGIPAHYPKTQPESSLQVVDLFNAETASMLAWTIYMLGEQIDLYELGYSKEFSSTMAEPIRSLSEIVREEIDRRFLYPTLHEPQGWQHNVNNWNTWITSNWIECTLICERDSADRNAALTGAASCLSLFQNGYPADGGCEEGVGYWDRAAASLFEGLYFLNAQNIPAKQLQAMGQFITTMHIRDLQFVNFSDATAKNLPNINILFPFGACLQDAPMMELAAYIAEQYDYIHHPSKLFLQSGNFPSLSRELLLLSMLPQLQATTSRQPHTADAFLEQSQIMVANNGTWFLAAKGGNNDESHNHNDIGSFILYHNNTPVVIDLGRDTYTSQTFSAHRYELMNNRSAYHNVPCIHGCEQMAGASHKATDVCHTSSNNLSSLSMDIAQTYPDSAGVVSWVQTLTLDRKSNRVTVSAQFISDSTLQSSHTTLMCYGAPHLVRKGIIALQDGHVLLRYDAKLLTPSFEKVIMNDGIMKEQWHDNIYRLTLTLSQKALKKGLIGYSFVQK